MFQKNDYKLYQQIGEYSGFLIALLIFVSLLFFIIIRKIVSISYFNLVGIIFVVYLIYVIIKLLKLWKDEETVHL